jgi:multimeric flavodoxin WrbA
MKVLGISASPRENSNSDMLLRETLSGASSAGAEAEYLRLCKFNIAPCSACGACYTTGECPVGDDFQAVLPKILAADRIIFATPIFFMSVCAQAKILIDRCQCLWATKYILKRPIIGPREISRLAMVIAVGGKKGGKAFDCIRLMMKYYLDTVDMGYFANLFVSNADEAGKIAENTNAIQEAIRLGKELALAAGPVPGKTVDVELAG